MKPANFYNLACRSCCQYLPPISKGACRPESKGLFPRQGDASAADFPPFAPSWETPNDPASQICISNRETPVQGDSRSLEPVQVKASHPHSDLNGVRLSAPSLLNGEGELQPAEDFRGFAHRSSTELQTHTFRKSEQSLAQALILRHRTN